jgi:hypothetical protein
MCLLSLALLLAVCPAGANQFVRLLSHAGAAAEKEFALHAETCKGAATDEMSL